MTSNSVWRRLLFHYNKYCGLWWHLHIFRKYCTFKSHRAIIHMWNRGVLVNFPKCSTGSQVSIGCCAHMPLSIMPHVISVSRNNSSNKFWSTNFPMNSCDCVSENRKHQTPKDFSSQTPSSVVCNYLGQLGGLIICNNLCSLYVWLFFLRKANEKMHELDLVHHDTWLQGSSIDVIKENCKRHESTWYY